MFVRLVMVSNYSLKEKIAGPRIERAYSRVDPLSKSRIYTVLCLLRFCLVEFCGLFAGKVCAKYSANTEPAESEVLLVAYNRSRDLFRVKKNDADTTL
jgi:hypothetical protein